MVRNDVMKRLICELYLNFLLNDDVCLWETLKIRIFNGKNEMRVLFHNFFICGCQCDKGHTPITNYNTYAQLLAVFKSCK